MFGGTRRFHIALLVAVSISAINPGSAFACDWGYSSLPELFNRATDVFVGTVVEVDLRTARFAVRTRYKGAPRDEMTSRGGGDCTFPFVMGATYLVHGSVRDGSFYATYADLPLVVPSDPKSPLQRYVTEAIKYAEGRARNRPQAFVSGSLSDARGNSLRLSDADEFQVRAEHVGVGSTVTVPAPNTNWNMFHLVLLPGVHRITIIRNGAPVGPPVDITLADGDEVNLFAGRVVRRLQPATR